MNCGISYVQMRDGGGINMMRKRLWKITIMNTRTGKVSYRKVKKTYDGVTEFVKKIRNKNRYNSICAEEMNRRGKDIITDGRIVTIDSREDEILFRKNRKNDTIDTLINDEDELNEGCFL